MTLATERLLLRRWQPEDLSAFAEINSDPRVMEFFPSTLDREDTEAMIEKIETHFDANGFGFWAAELKEERRCIGFIGIGIPTFQAPFLPSVEIACLSEKRS